MDKYTLNQEDTVLLIIDIQERLAQAMVAGGAVMERTGILLAAARRLGLPVLVTEQYPKGLGVTVAPLRGRLEPVEIHEKLTFSACTDPVLSALKATGRRKVLVTGMETHVCVFQTVRGLLASGLQVFVVQDAVCSRREENRENALQQMREMGAVVTNTETVLFDLLKQAGTEEFRELSKLIR